jgi:hypothetical protein
MLEIGTRYDSLYLHLISYLIIVINSLYKLLSYGIARFEKHSIHVHHGSRATGIRGVLRKAGGSQRRASGELTHCERGSLSGMAKMITAEPREPLGRAVHVARRSLQARVHSKSNRRCNQAGLQM